MLRGGAASTGFEHGTLVKHGHNRKHLSTGTELQDREQVWQVISQHISSHGNGVSASAGVGYGGLHGFSRLLNQYIQTAGVVVRKILVNQVDDICVVCTFLV